jgi:sigma-B regulation protein RsbU (phosphoserine phosphatase)
MADAVVTDLHSLLEFHVDQLEKMAQAWLTAGAARFSVRSGSDDVMVWSHPHHSASTTPAFAASIKMHGQIVAELHVAGLNALAHQAHLSVDAALLGKLFELEGELDVMTGELIEGQDQLLALYGLAQSMRNHLNLDQVLYSLTREAARLVKAEAACSLLVIEYPPVMIYYPEPLLSEQDMLTFFSQIQDTERHMILENRSDSAALPATIKNLLMEPIRVRGQILACLGLMNKSGGFNSPDIKLARTICDQVGAQIDNALLYQESLAQARLQTEMDLAHNVQVNLLPKGSPTVLGLDLYASSLPASSVGGDFYDFFHRAGEPFLFTVGDVTGKGIPAALLMAMTRTVFRSQARSIESPTPADVLGALNDDLYDDFTEVGMFATVFIGQYDHREGLMYYANAGHSPVIYCPVAGSAHLLEADGTAIGVLPTSLCENQVISFGPGDILVVATDGFSEERDPYNQMFGYERLLSLVELLAEEPAARIASGLYEALNQFGAGRPRDDDQTLIVVKGV